MKKILLIIMMLGFCVQAFAQGMTLSEVKELISQETREYYELPDERMNKWIEETLEKSPHLLPPSIKPDYDGYYYLALNMTALWQKLGLDPQRCEMVDRRGCDLDIFSHESAKRNFVSVSNPKIQFHEYPGIKILQISDSNEWNSQYLFFTEQSGQWRFADYFNLSTQKYQKPQLVFLNDNLFYFRVLGMHGTGIIEYLNIFFTLRDQKLEQLLLCLDSHQLSGWGMPFDRDVQSQLTFDEDVLSVDYAIDIKLGVSYCSQPGVDCPSEKDIFVAQRRLVFIWGEGELVFDPYHSNTTAEETVSLSRFGVEDYLRVFKEEFNEARKNPDIQQWFKDLE